MFAERPWLSVVIPVYNEEDNVEPLLDELWRVLDGIGRPYEIVVVDDGSTDQTPQRLCAMGPRVPGLRLVRFTENAGQSAAFVAGFEAARGDVVVTMDGDLQNNPADIPRLLPFLSGYDMICGVRRRRRDRLLRRVSSRVANAVRRAVTHDRLEDVGCSLKVFRAGLLSGIPRFDGMHRFLPVLLQWLGARVLELDVDHRPRRAGVGKYNIRNRALRTGLDLLAVRWLRARLLRYHVRP